MKLSRLMSKSSRLICLLILLMGLAPIQNEVLARSEIRAKQERLLKEVLVEFEEKYQVFFNFKSSLIKDKKVHFEFKEGEKFELAVDRLLISTGLEYQIINEKFILLFQNSKKGKKDLNKIRKKIQQIEKLQKKGRISVNRNSPNPSERFNTILKSQGTVKTLTPIKGTIKDEAGEPLIGVNILIKGTSKGTVTDVNGQFSIDVEDANAILLVSYIGYESMEVPLNGQSDVAITMQTNTSALDEVVVVGYGAVKKSDLTGSVASINTDELDRQPITTIDQGLQGLAAGVQVQQTSGAPGGAITLRIRGSNSISAGNDPLYVIDGLPIVANNAAASASPTITGFGANQQPGQPASPLATISPNDIASIEILKDASATALYGARASNGVVLITTKSGRAGKVSINLDSYIGTQELTSTVDFMSAAQHRSYLEDAINTGASTLSLSDLPSNNTDWMDLVLEESPTIQSHTLGVSGGNQRVLYNVSANYFDQKGILKNTGINRTNLRANLDITATDKLKIGVRTNTSFTNNQIQLQNGTGNYQTTNSPFTWAQWLSPLQAVRDSEGEFFLDYFTGDPMSNPEAMIASNVVNEFRTFRTFGTIFAEYEIFKNFRYKVNFGVDISSNKRNSFFPDTHPFGRFVGGLGAVSNNLLTNWVLENLFYYDYSSGAHKIGLIGGITSQKERVESSVLQAQEFQIDNLSFNSLQQGSVFQGVTGVNVWTLQSFFAQANYSFLDRYLLTANIRADGSSKFGENNRWGYFPSLAFAWRLYEEPFFASLQDVFSSMKVRASYGVVGNQEIPANLAFASFTNSNEANLSNDTESEGVNTLLLASLANPDLKWETTQQLNIGLDFGFLDNRITATANYYQKITDDLLLVTPLPPTSGFSSALQNVGQVENSGFELALTTVNIDKELKWNTNFNISTNRNEVTALSSEQEQVFINVGSLQSIDAIFALEVGQPLGVFYGYQFEGVYQTGDTDIPDGFAPGDPRYADLSGPDGVPDGQINAADRTIIGDPNPDFVIGLSNNFEYKGFDLSIFINGEINKDMINWNRTFWETGLVNFQRTSAAADAWSTSNPSNSIPRIGFQTPISSQGTEVMSSRVVEDGTFIRLRNLTLGYSVPLGQSTGISSLRFYVTGQNLLTLTDYSGFDPESNYRAGSATIQGFDFGSYPLQRTYLFGVQAKF